VSLSLIFKDETHTTIVLAKLIAHATSLNHSQQESREYDAVIFGREELNTHSTKISTFLSHTTTRHEVILLCVCYA